MMVSARDVTANLVLADFGPTPDSKVLIARQCCPVQIKHLISPTELLYPFFPVNPIKIKKTLTIFYVYVGICKSKLINTEVLFWQECGNGINTVLVA